mmetsp:Transcript_45739/g.145747  ORF Transcript_45739/g.145747 Transcript_45739/m.145747 type:complete len:311 (+) Transcript_45739:3144-4076(+)
MAARATHLSGAAVHLSHALDLLGAAHHGVELGLLCLGGEVGAVLLERGGLVAAGAAAGTGAGAHSLSGLAHHADNLGANLRGVGPKVLEHAGGHALALAEEAEEEVLGADIVVAELPGLLERELEHALGAGGEGDLHSDEAGAAADDLLDLHAGLLEVDAHRLEHLGSDASALANETEQDLLGAHEVVAEAAGLLLREHYDLDRLLGEALEHSLGVGAIRDLDTGIGSSSGDSGLQAHGAALLADGVHSVGRTHPRVGGKGAGGGSHGSTHRRPGLLGRVRRKPGGCAVLPRGHNGGAARHPGEVGHVNE